MIYSLGEREIIALQDQDASFDNEKSESFEPLGHNPGSSAIDQKHVKCHMCEDSECSSPDICDDAITVKILISPKFFKFALKSM